MFSFALVIIVYHQRERRLPVLLICQNTPPDIQLSHIKSYLSNQPMKTDTRFFLVNSLREKLSSINETVFKQWAFQ